ncbi:MAG: hypothetical protein COV46_02740 [Deltaproteobacteria bacterium CG11_big_fil_rev_8_21_14_0_20_49_13]|nr:MAG: hypothetical protein COV46_02740 [Deltaproteobacteria bacterium CG11_big_fil_rev_8_21_14_0_20_49_13]
MQKGVSIIGAVFTLLILAIFGSAIVSLTSTEHSVRRLQIEKEQAFYEVQAGLEYAVREIYNGGYPVVSNKGLGRGIFSVSIDAPNHIVYATGVSGDVTKTHQITYNNLAGDCLNVNNDQVTVVGPNKTDMKALTLKKLCNNAVSIDKLQFVWSPDNNEKVTQVKIENNLLYNSPSGAASGEIIDIPDYAISGGVAHQINLIKFTNNMLNKQFTITLYLTDTSYKTLQFVILPPNQN